MKKVRLDILGIFSNHPQETNFTLLLGERSGYRKLPIMIGVVEAQSIALALEGSSLERPMMHDLFKQTLINLGYRVEETIITTLKDEIFFAQLLITDGNETFIVDARPSDAIAISLRFGAPIFINDTLLSQAGGILISKSELPDTGNEVAGTDLHANPTDTTIINFEKYSVQGLKDMLVWVLEREDYEQAALIRDELKRRSK